MKKKYIFSLLVFGLLMVSAQEIMAQRSYLSVAFNPSYRTNGYGLNLLVNHYHNATDYWHVSLSMVNSKEQPDSSIEFPYTDYLMNVGYFKTVISRPNRGFYIYVGGGLSGGYEYINKGESFTKFGYTIPESGMLYGVFVSFEMDFYLTDALSLYVPVTGYYHVNSKVDESFAVVGAGVRYFFK
ncbi:conjugal transfer protein TraO [Flagellimonas zhangzhouensis]|uniref:Conjugative transposon protein TraO n=1 Tax=Flagellimonas zhangzhouensis TaxID=1073328 RepID=A0A1H2XBK0_9FLAO|nr:conjugal transfer protein TraO [Allomuricauda zhangzhouensis]SDQ30522.1 Conjugative transposon protein TraO [Allomuricauda zhangzhouensis]SDW90210.1 Conjugative transposon protein TraO [Allomuricauda zhangzhouensis]